MFKYWKEMRELKKQEKECKVYFMNKAMELSKGLPDIVEMAKKAKGMDVQEVQKLIVEELVKYMKTKDITEGVK
jgi:hypothetical protein